MIINIRNIAIPFFICTFLSVHLFAQEISLSSDNLLTDTISSYSFERTYNNNIVDKNIYIYPFSFDKMKNPENRERSAEEIVFPKTGTFSDKKKRKEE